MHPIPRPQQRLHPRTPLSLNPHRRLKINSIVAGVRSNHHVQPVDPSHTLRQPCPGQHSASLILHLNVVVIFRPIITNKKH
jgi:hypothetical protein